LWLNVAEALQFMDFVRFIRGDTWVDFLLRRRMQFSEPMNELFLEFTDIFGFSIGVFLFRKLF
jgi:hypothetical protein